VCLEPMLVLDSGSKYAGERRGRIHTVVLVYVMRAA